MTLAESMQDSTSPVIDLHDITFTYPGPPRIEAIRGVTLKVFGGDFLTIMGPSGSGKSTLLNVLGLLDRPSSGSYLLDGSDVSQLDDRARTRVRASRIGFVFQDAYVLDRLTCFANVALALALQRVPRRERPGRVAAALGEVGLSGFESRMAGRLSGGQRQRLAIARALAGNPTIVLADEPTGNIDSAATKTVLEVFDSLHQKGTTLLVITHDPLVGARGTRSVHYVDGRLDEGDR